MIDVMVASIWGDVLAGSVSGIVATLSAAGLLAVLKVYYRNRMENRIKKAVVESVKSPGHTVGIDGFGVSICNNTPYAFQIRSVIAVRSTGSTFGLSYSGPLETPSIPLVSKVARYAPDEHGFIELPPSVGGIWVIPRSVEKMPTAWKNNKFTGTVIIDVCSKNLLQQVQFQKVVISDDEDIAALLNMALESNGHLSKVDD